MKRVVMVGVSHHTAPVEVRERLAFSSEKAGSAAAQLCTACEFPEAVILSTCNRSEVYVVAPDEGGEQAAGRWFREFHGVRPADISDCLCVRPEAEAVRHLFRVASGLDSLLLGEAEILGQVREAYKVALQHKTTGPVLNRLFQSALEAGKRVRTQTDLGARPMSVAFAGVKLAERVFGKLAGHRALVLGAGAVAEQVADHMRNRGLAQLLVANRTAERAEALAQRFNGCAVRWQDLDQALYEVEIVVTSLSGGDRFLTREMVQRVMNRRANREFFLVDLGVPRNVAPEVRDLYNVFLYDLEDLAGIVEQNKKARQDEIPRAEAIVSEHVVKFQTWIAGVELVDLVLALRAKMRHEREQILHEHLDRIRELTPDARRKAVRSLQALVDRILQEPTTDWEDSQILRGDAPELRAVREIIGLAGEKL